MNTDIESKLTSALSGIVGIQQYMIGLPERKSAAEQILESDNFRAFYENKSDTCRIELKTAITRTNLANDPLVPAHKPAVDPGTRRSLRVRGLLRQYTVEQGAVEMPVCDSKTVNADGQVGGSPEAAENVTLPASALSFTNSFMPVVNYAHFVPVSNQLFEDSGQFQAFIDGEMRHGLQLGIENGLLNHTGTTGKLAGLLNNATSYSVRSPQVATEAGILRDALRQVEAADFVPDAIVVNPADWYDIDAAITGGNQRLIDGPRLWGLPVVVSNSIASGTFLVGDFANCGSLFVRDSAAIEIARSDSTNFQSNMVTIRAQERLALVVTNSLALVSGSL